jgi:hypothetical protein
MKIPMDDVETTEQNSTAERENETTNKYIFMFK